MPKHAHERYDFIPVCQKGENPVSSSWLMDKQAWVDPAEDYFAIKSTDTLSNENEPQGH